VALKFLKLIDRPLIALIYNNLTPFEMKEIKAYVILFDSINQE
jgi:hypothetical protein